MSPPLKHKKTPLPAILLTITVGGVLTGAHAATVVYNSRASFDTAAASENIPLAIESYETYPADLLPGARTLSLVDVDVSYDLSGNISNFGISDVPNPFGGTGIGATVGTNYLVANYPTSAVPTAAVTFVFAAPITAFGTDIRDLENISLTYNTNSGENGTAASPMSDGAVQFFGLISDTPFTSITFTGPGEITGDGVVFDETTFSVPEPSTVVAGMIGILALGLRRKRD